MIKSIYYKATPYIKIIFYLSKKKKKKTHSLFVTKNAVMDEIINSNLSIISLCN